MEHLGYIISDQGVSIDPKKVAAMTNWPRPTTVKALRGFMGFTDYCRRFVKGYGGRSRPFTDLLKKDNFEWDHKAKAAIE